MSPPERPLIEAISQSLPELNKAFRRVGIYLTTSPDGFMHNSLQEIARVAEVSGPSVVRFCRHFGFKGMSDFRIALAMSLASRKSAESSFYLEPKLNDKAAVNLEMKMAIARFAMSLVDDDRSIIVDSGSTTQLFAAHLRTAEKLVIMTTGLNIVETLRGASQHTVMLPGGTVRFESNSVSGRLVESTLVNMRFDTLYLGADSIDPVRGISTFNEAEAHQNAAMMNISQRVVVMADSTKFQAPGLHRFCEIDRIHAIITDTGLSEHVAGLMKARGVSVHRVAPDKGGVRWPD